MAKSKGQLVYWASQLHCEGRVKLGSTKLELIVKILFIKLDKSWDKEEAWATARLSFLGKPSTYFKRQDK
jgi:hypothetical protein